MYDMPVVEIKGKAYYMTSGQPSRPWLYPALKSGTKDSSEITKKHVSKTLKKGLR